MEKEDWEQRLEDFYFEREKILPNQSVGIDIDDWKEFIQQELDKAREEGRESVIAELSISEGMEAIERFFREAPVDYDDKCNLWIDFLSKLKDNK